MAKRDIEALPNFDHNQTSLAIATHNGYFQNVMAFMGFTEGLLAMFEEPEAVKELVMYMNDFYVPFAKKCMEAYDADIIDLGDDMATATDPFVSVEMYRDMIKPAHARHAAVGLEMGKAATMHNCGRCEDLLPPMVEIGVNVWDPAQVENDLVAVKERFGRKLVINGGYEYRMPATWPNVDEEEVRQTVRDTFAKLAPNGGYVFSGRVKSMERNDPDVQRVNGWILDEAIRLSETMYK
jgi:uroporphyrinogen-III decarboxylase